LRFAHAWCSSQLDAQYKNQDKTVTTMVEEIHAMAKSISDDNNLQQHAALISSSDLTVKNKKVLELMKRLPVLHPTEEENMSGMVLQMYTYLITLQKS
jgi:hypothetical protein